MMHRNRHPFVTRVFLRSEKPICLKIQICVQGIGENAILMHFNAVVLDMRSSGELWKVVC